MFSEKVKLIQEETDQQTDILKRDQVRLQNLVEERDRQLHKDYIKLEYHEEMLTDKEKTIARLNHEFNLKVKNLEKNMTDEFDTRQLATKSKLSTMYCLII